MLAACRNGETQTALALIAAGANVNCKNDVSPCLTLIRIITDDEDMLRPDLTSPACLSMSLSYHQGGKTPLHLACWNGKTELVLALIAKGADMHCKNTVSPCLTFTRVIV